jgi:diguanylate cyclase (GGDEF)-like protein/PAS domain S-box-containing protein
MGQRPHGRSIGAQGVIIGQDQREAHAFGDSPIPRWPRGFMGACVGAVAFLGVFLVWLALTLGGKHVTLRVDNLAQLVAPLGAAIACLTRGRRESGRSRRGWTLLGASALSWGLGQAVWCYYELVQGREVPFPSMADLGYLLAVPLALGAILAFFSPPVGWTSRVRAMVDGLIVAASFLLISWETALGSVYRGGQGGPVKQAIALAYPLGDVLIISVVVLVAGRSRSVARLPLVWIGAALVALAVSDSAFAYLTQMGDYATGNPVDAGWVAGYLILLLAALKPYSGVPGVERRGQRERTLLPYIPVLIALCLVGVRAARGSVLEGFLLWNALALFFIVVVRQVLTLRENRSLTHDLETKVQERTHELRSSERRFRSLIRNASDVVCIVEHDAAVRYVSASIERMFGWGPNALKNGNLLDILHSDDAPRMLAFIASIAGQQNGQPLMAEFRLRHFSESWRDVEVFGTNLVEDEAVQGLVLNIRDISERKAFEAELEHQALHDPLTGLPNRVLFRDRVEQALAGQRRDGGGVAVLFFDIDDFKNVNDSLGHTVGDSVLQEVARRLDECQRAVDTAARMGGDEFGVLVRSFKSETDVVEIAERVMSALSTSVPVDGRQISIRPSIGIAFGSDDARAHSDADQLLRDADVAMYMAKEQGRGGYQIFQPEMHSRALARLELKADLERALDAGEFTLRYQPIMDLARADLAGMEALVRWEHPSRGTVPPLDFIPLVEDTGLIVPLGHHVLTQACKWAAHMQQACPRDPPLWVSVNVSARQLQREEFVDEVSGVLEQAAIAPSSLILELTESVAMKDTEVSIRRMDALRALGVRLAIDDFGTGYSSLNYVRQLPVDILKIDRSFVADPSPEVAEMTAAIVRLAEIFKLQVVPEGIETEVQLRHLQEMHCAFGQGFYFAKPLCDDEILSMALEQGVPAGRPQDRARDNITARASIHSG